MDWSNIGKEALEIIAKVAPGVGTALGGPLGGLAGAALASVLGVDETPEAVEASIKAADPEVLLKLRAADYAFQLEIYKLEVDRLKKYNKTKQVEAGAEHRPTM